MANAVLHETRDRLRVHVGARASAADLTERLAALAGVRSVRLNERARCVVITHDGRPGRRDAVLAEIAFPGGARGGRAPAARRGRAPASAGAAAAAKRDFVAPIDVSGVHGLARPAQASVQMAATVGSALLASALPLMPREWRAGGAIALVGARLVAQQDRLKEEPAAVLLDAASLAALGVGGHPLVVSASVLLRTAAELGGAYMLRQVDGLIAQLLPIESPRYAVMRSVGRGETGEPAWVDTDLASIAAGDRVRLAAGAIVPVDGWVLVGQASLASPTRGGDVDGHAVSPGDHLPAGERLLRGAIELLVESPASASRLERMRAHVRHAIGTRDPPGRIAVGVGRMTALPFAAAAVVLGLTSDTTRSAAMLQADPVLGLDLSLPLAREATLYSLARHGMLTGGLETTLRLAIARTLVLQDSGVLATGRWRVASIRVEAGTDEAQVREWLAKLAGWPVHVPCEVCLSDAQVRRWVREGELLCEDGRELHLSGEARARRIWGLQAAATAAPRRTTALRRRVLLVRDGRLAATVELSSAMRDGVPQRLAELRAAGFERIAVVAEDDAGTMTLEDGLERVPADWQARSAWLAQAVRAGVPVVMVHTMLRDLVPPGSLGLCPVEADVGAHGVLLGDPLASLVAARRVARRVEHRLRRQQTGAVVLNAALMTASATQWMPPIATAIVHHGFAFALLVDSLGIERLGRRDRPSAIATVKEQTQ